MLLRCEVQRVLLQCLITSVWHYQQKQQPPDNTGAKGPRSTSSYLYPANRPVYETDPAANAFINEILEFNDYPVRIIAKSLDGACGTAKADFASELQITEENELRRFS